MKYARQKELIEIIQNQGYLNAASAAEAFGVSIATIRRDLKQLEHQGEIWRSTAAFWSSHRHAAFYFSPEPFPRQ